MIDPRDTPLIAALGGLDAARSKFRVGLNGTKIELLEDELDPLATTANHGTTITTNATVITVTDSSFFQDGHVIQIDSEYMVVKSTDTTNNKITVYSRSYGGTNATHASTDAITIVGMARLEGDDADYGPVVDITAPYNYTSIFHKALRVTGTQQVIAQYGISDEFAYQSAKAVPHLMRLIERSLFNGVRAAGSASAPRSMGGLGTFVTDNATAVSGALTLAKINACMESIMDDGGNPNLLVLNHAVAGDLHDVMDSTSYVRVGLENALLGMAELRRVQTQFGDLALLMDRWCPTSTGYILDSERVGLYTLRPFAFKELAVTGDSVKGEVVGEFSLLVGNDKAHGKLTGITT
jgi:hypothetical protein